jgi:formylglycine-generating enzyme required for sulfatase activity
LSTNGATEHQRQQVAQVETDEQPVTNNTTQQMGGNVPVMVHIPGKDYEIGKYEITQAEWHVVMGNNPSKYSNCGDTCPVEEVSWDDVQKFIRRLNQKTGKQYRLPTEVEWEYACYGGSQSEYCGGDNLDAVAWYEKNSNNQTHPVGQKQANGYGLYDMSGNVWEWTQDCYGSSCDIRALRGGSWFNGPQFESAAKPFTFVVAVRYGSYGFRVARTLP